LEALFAILFLIWIFFCHTIADFILQTRWMAENKSSSLKALTVHIIEYTTVMFVGLILPFGLANAALYAVINGVLHFFTDFITSRLSSYAYKNEKMKLFWGIIGFDQFIHISCMLLTLLFFSF